MKEEKIVYNFCGCEVVLRADIPENRELQIKYILLAEKELKRIFDKEFHIPNERELQKIVENDLGVKKHWLFGWIKQ